MVSIYCCINSGAIWGIEPYVVKVESDISQGLPCFNMVGLLSSEVREARERVRSAIKNSGEKLPMYRVTVNLSPADRRKEGTGFDLPIAISLLCAMGRLDAKKFENILIMGELGLDGNIKGINGILPIINMAKSFGFSSCIIPRENINEARFSEGVDVFTFATLKEMIEYFDAFNSGTGIEININKYRNIDMMQDKKEFEDIELNNDEKQRLNINNEYYKNNYTVNNSHLSNNYDICNNIEELNKQDFSDIYGQEIVKRAILIAVSGWHNMLMIGPPGVGKSMLACRIPTIMTDMNDDEKREVLNIQSICGLLGNSGYRLKRPYSAPHHTITKAALVGGGKEPRPGEITIANKGVLFLDELPEFSPIVLDSLRQPIEEKVVKIHRVNGNYVFPADCLIVAAMNPCKCGYYPDRNKCKCSEVDVANYLGRISGPIIDRIDMSVEVPRVTPDDIGVTRDNIDSKTMKFITDKAVKRQHIRQKGKYNSQLSTDEIRNYCRLKKEESQFMKEAYTKFNLSMRGYYKIIRIARTIADIDGDEEINVNHLAESLGYRLTDNKYFC